MNKILIRVNTLLLIGLLTTLTVIAQVPTPKKNIVFFGSSVCRGTGDNTALGYAGRFAAKLDTAKWKYFNASKGGDNTIKITGRLDTNLYVIHPDYVVIGLSLGNEGIIQPETEISKGRITERFRTGLLRLADSISAHGAKVIITNCYPHNQSDELTYQLTKEMNSIINEWPVPSINLLGAVDDGTGKWAPGYWKDDLHPNNTGHEEMSLTIVPTLFDAIDRGKPVPYRNWKSDYFILNPVQSIENDPLRVTVKEKMHSFSVSIMFMMKGNGVIEKIYHTNGVNIIAKEKSELVYGNKESSVRIPLVNSDSVQWQYLTISHNYAMGRTIVFVNGVQTTIIKEKLEPVIFSLGGAVEKGANSLSALSLKDWMIHRSSLNESEAKDYMKWKMIRSSLEVYIPFSMGPTPASEMENLAQSLTVVEADRKISYKVVRKGFVKYPK
jgi:lysophospholipase L1-like esterase